MAAKRKRESDHARSHAPPEKQQLWTALRQAQRRCGCNTKTVKTLFQVMQPFCQDDAGTSATDAAMFSSANAVCLQLHGCVRCNNFVFTPENTALRCPKCHHPRFNRKKRPNEVSCFMFIALCLILRVCVWCCVLLRRFFGTCH